MGKICLAMIVANEKPVIERCLNSLENIIDQICISINEDKDGTQECIERWGRERNIPTTVWYDPWKGYGPNKTRNLLKIKEEIDTEYIIFIDADEVFVTDPKNPLSYLTKEEGKKLKTELDKNNNIDVFHMKSHYGRYIYSRWQIVRNNQVWIWHLPYQEFLQGEKSNRRYNIDWIYNYVRHDGHSSRHPDLENNIKILEKWVQDNPKSEHLSRAYFYLGQAYYESSNNEKGIYYLEKRLEYEGWYQEKYIANYYLANIYKRLEKTIERKKHLLKCVEIDNTRLEAYYYLMLDSFDNNKREAIGWAIMAPNNRKPPSSAFLIQEELYTYKFDFELSIKAYYAALKNSKDCYDDIGLFQIGLEALERCEKNIPNHLKELCNNNKNFYLNKLKVKNINIHPTSTLTSTPTIKNSIIKYKDNKSLIIVDDFYDNPDDIRNIALNMNYDIVGNYPGKRTKPFYIDGIKEKLESILNKNITYWPDKYNGSFQYTTQNNKSWIHRDATQWSVIVYLTPNAPLDSGTKTYIHKPTGLRESFNNKDIEEKLNNDTYNYNNWGVIDKIGNIYNRALFFKGLKTHKSDQYFGSTLQDGRLFQTFFFNC